MTRFESLLPEALRKKRSKIKESSISQPTQRNISIKSKYSPTLSRSLSDSCSSHSFLLGLNSAGTTGLVALVAAGSIDRPIEPSLSAAASSFVIKDKLKRSQRIPRSWTSTPNRDQVTEACASQVNNASSLFVRSTTKHQGIENSRSAPHLFCLAVNDDREPLLQDDNDDLVSTYEQTNLEEGHLSTIRQIVEINSSKLSQKPTIEIFLSSPYSSIDDDDSHHTFNRKSSSTCSQLDSFAELDSESISNTDENPLLPKNEIGKQAFPKLAEPNKMATNAYISSSPKQKSRRPHEISTSSMRKKPKDVISSEPSNPVPMTNASQKDNVDSLVVDEFEYYCQLAHSPIRSTSSTPPSTCSSQNIPISSTCNSRNASIFSMSSPVGGGITLLQTMAMNSLTGQNELPSEPKDSIEIPPGGLKPFASSKPNYRSRSVKERRSSKRAMLGDDPGFRNRTMSRSLRVRSTRRHQQQAQLGPESGESGDNSGCASLGTSPPTKTHLGMPGKDGPHQVYRVRSFKRTSKGVVSQGDSLRARSVGCLDVYQQQASAAQVETESQAQNSTHSRSGANSSDMLSPTQTVSYLPSAPHRQPPLARLAPTYNSIRNTPVDIGGSFCIQVLGGPGVGKSTLCQQFMTSEFLGGKSENVSEEREERYVTVQLDNQEWNLTFLDSVNVLDPMDVEIVDSVDAYMVVYAIDDQFSFEYAKQMLSALYTLIKRSVALFLVANKSDLVRGREVSNGAGRKLATIYGCKFLEISTALNHLVDKLLVGIVVQIGNHIRKAEKAQDDELRHPGRVLKTKRGPMGCSFKIKSTGHIISQFFRRHFDAARSCEDLTSDVKF